MKPSRILSIFVVSIVFLAVVCISVFIFTRPKKDKTQYATDIEFVTMIGEIEISIDNYIVVDDSMVKILPNNCEFDPEFTVKEYGQSEDSAVIIDNGKYLFNKECKYTLSCRVKSSAYNYVKDSIVINVVEDITAETDMYILPINYGDIYVEDVVFVNELINIKAPSQAVISIIGSEHFEITENLIKVIDEGDGSLDVYVTYDNFTISTSIEVDVKPKITINNTNIVITYRGNIVDNNIVEVDYTPLSDSFNYKIPNMDTNQEIDCWTDSNLLQIVRYNSPTVVFKTLGVGTANIYISPIKYPNVIFEIIIVIN